jgi:flagellar motor switch protein FliN/FliY
MDGTMLALRVLLSLACVVGLIWILGRKLAGGQTRRTPVGPTMQVVGRQALGRHAGVAVGNDLVGEGLTAFALLAGGVPQAWFGIRNRTRTTSVPSQRDPRQHADMRLLYDVEMTLTAEIGRTRLPIRQVLELIPGSVLELDRAAGAPADIMVNGRLIARGEVVVVDEDYGIRITEIVAADQTTA